MAHGLFVHADGHWSVEKKEPFQDTLEVRACVHACVRARARFGRNTPTKRLCFAQGLLQNHPGAARAVDVHVALHALTFCSLLSLLVLGLALRCTGLNYDENEIQVRHWLVTNGTLAHLAF